LKNELISLALFEKQDERDFDGHPFHSQNVKLLGRYLGPLEKLPFLMVSVLRFVIFFKAFPFHCITFSFEGQFKYIISIFPVPF